MADPIQFTPTSQAERDAAIAPALQFDQTVQFNEQDKKKKEKERQQQAAQIQQQQTSNKQAAKSPGNPVLDAAREVGTAVVGAGIDFVEGAGATAEQFFTGQATNENFTPTWLQVPDDQEPLNKTMWGQVIRSIGEIGFGSLLVRGAGKVAGKTPIPGVKQAGQFLSEKAATKSGEFVREAVRDIIVGNLSSQAEGNNLGNLFKEFAPAWFPTPTAIEDGDSPIFRRLKNIGESIGIGLPFHLIGAAYTAWKAGKSAEILDAVKPLEKADAGYAVKPKGKTVEEVKGAKTTVEQVVTGAKSFPPPSAPTGTKKAKSIDAAIAAFDNEIQTATKQQKENFDEMAASRFVKDPEGVNGPDTYVNPQLYDNYEKGILSVDTKKGLTGALIDAWKISKDAKLKEGRVRPIFTESALENRLAAGSEARRKVLESVAKELEGDKAFQDQFQNIYVPKEGYKKLAIARALDMLEDFDTADLDVLRERILEGGVTYTVGGKEVKVMSPESVAASELFMRVAAGELTDIAAGEFSIRGVLDTKHQENMIMRRLEFLMKEKKLSDNLASRTLNARKVGGAKLLDMSPESLDDVQTKIDKDVEQFMGTLRRLRDEGDPRLLQAFMDAARITDGKVDTLDKMAKYVKDKVGLFKWDNPNNGLVRGLQSTFVNSALSSIRTSQRAFIGNTLTTALRPLTTMIGGTLRGDQRIQAKAFAQTQALMEGVPEALSMFAKSWKSFLTTREVPYEGIAQKALGEWDRYAFHLTDEWKALENYVESRGSIGDKAGYYLATQLSRFNNFPLVAYPMGLLGSTDALTRTLFGRMHLKGLAFDKAWSEAGGKIDPKLVKSYEQQFRSLVFDKNGIVTDKAAMMAADEATLTKELSEQWKHLDRAIQSMPALQPLFMFLRTGINAAEVMLSYAPSGANYALRKVPILNTFLREVDEVMSATPETAQAVMTKYGITDLPAAQAMYEGRVAVGNMLVFGAGMLYMQGRLSGDGPYDKEVRNTWTANGWQSRSIKFGENTWISYGPMEPLAGILAMAATIYENGSEMGSKWQEDWNKRLGYTVAMGVTNKTFLAGIQPLAELLSTAGASGDDAGAKLAANIINTALPWAALRRDVADLINPGMRELENNFWDHVKNRNPVLRGTLPYKNDFLSGKPLRLYDPVTTTLNSISALPVNPNWSETRDILIQSGYPLSTAMKTININGQVIKLDNFERSEIIKMIGESGGIEKQLEDLFKSNVYRESFNMLKAEREKGTPSHLLPIKATQHYWMIDKIVQDAKKVAYAKMKQRIGTTEKVRQAQSAGLAQQAAREGRNTDAQQILNLLQVNK